MRKNKGFTLVELLAVIVILALILSFSIVNVSKIAKRQQEKNKENEISGILTGAKNYIADNNFFPDKDISVTDLISNGYVKVNKESDYSGYVYYKSCSSTSAKTYVQYTIDATIYNDCGCVEQSDSNYNIGDKTTYICKGNNGKNN